MKRKQKLKQNVSIKKMIYIEGILILQFHEGNKIEKEKRLCAIINDE